MRHRILLAALVITSCKTANHSDVSGTYAAGGKKGGSWYNDVEVEKSNVKGKWTSSFDRTPVERKLAKFQFELKGEQAKFFRDRLNGGSFNANSDGFQLKIDCSDTVCTLAGYGSAYHKFDDGAGYDNDELALEYKLSIYRKVALQLATQFGLQPLMKKTNTPPNADDAIQTLFRSTSSPTPEDGGDVKHHFNSRTYVLTANNLETEKDGKKGKTYKNLRQAAQTVNIECSIDRETIDYTYPSTMSYESKTGDAFVDYVYGDLPAQAANQQDQAPRPINNKDQDEYCSFEISFNWKKY